MLTSTSKLSLKQLLSFSLVYGAGLPEKMLVRVGRTLLRFK